MAYNQYDIPDMRSVNDTAANFNISRCYARRLALSGAVHSVRTSAHGKIYINQQSLADYFNSQVIHAGDTKTEQLEND